MKGLIFMNDGYIIIKRGREIIRAVYSRKADFTSEFCGLARELFLTGDVEKFNHSILVRLEKLDCPPVKSKHEKFYKRKSKNDFEMYPHFVYEYDIKRQRMTVYFNGFRMIAFNRNEIDYFDFFIKNYSRIRQAFGRSPDDYRLHDNLACYVFAYSVKYRRALADLERDIEIGLANTSFIVEEDDYDMLGYRDDDFLRDITFYDSHGKKKYCATLEVSWIDTNDKVLTCEVKLASGGFAYPLFTAHSVRDFRRKVKARLHKKRFIDCLERFCQFNIDDNAIAQKIIKQSIKPIDEQLIQLDDFCGEISDNILETYTKFAHDDFSVLLPSHVFSLTERRQDCVSQVLAYRNKVLSA